MNSFCMPYPLVWAEPDEAPWVAAGAGAGMAQAPVWGPQQAACQVAVQVRAHLLPEHTLERASLTPWLACAGAAAAGEGVQGRWGQQAVALQLAGPWLEASSRAGAPGAACHRSRTATSQGTCAQASAAVDV